MKEKRKQKEPIPVILLIALTFLLLLSRILYIDFTRGDLMPQYRDPEINTEFYRGTIYAEDGNILAIDVPSYSIHFSGKPIREPARIAAMVSPYTDLDPLFIERSLKHHNGEPFSIPSILGSISRDEFQLMIESENLGNLISIEKTVEREYPFQSHGEFIVGRTHDGLGISGAEKEADSRLTAPLDYSRTISKGEDIILAIDMELQYATETVMEKLLPKNQIFSLLAVLDRNTLEVLALDQTQIHGNPAYLEVIEKVVGSEISLLSSDETRNLPGDFPSVLGGAFICHHLSDKYLILSISSSEKFANAGLGTLKALLEARNMI